MYSITSGGRATGSFATRRAAAMPRQVETLENTPLVVSAQPRHVRRSVGTWLDSGTRF